MARLWELLFVATRLGLTSFGGPIAHLGYFRAEYVHRRKWLDEAAYADVVALCQFLPGPASSQVGIAIGMMRAGLPGGFVAWLGFTLPSAVALALFAYGVASVGDIADVGWLRGLKIAAVAVVALAVWGMARSLTPGRPRVTIAIGAAIALLFGRGAVDQIGVIVVGGLLGWFFLRVAPVASPPTREIPVPRAVAVGALAIFAGLLAALPWLRAATGSQAVAVFDSFYRAGALVFGGGHAVLPLLQAEVVPPGWLTNEQFIAGYGAAQAVPGPLFTVSAYLGTAMHLSSTPLWWLGGLLALGAIFLPSFLLVAGALPFWNSLRAMHGARRTMAGINAAVVGLLLAALYDPVWTSAIEGPSDVALALAAFLGLAFWKLPPWLVVVLAAVGGAVLG
ncbi:MAG: chromate efflux transporter [SAR202 cluster bacterium]|nr:chromate efflux transporter [SAR202 cluster bacterium]